MSTDAGQWHWLVLATDAGTVGDHRTFLGSVGEEGPHGAAGTGQPDPAPHLHLGYWTGDPGPARDLFRSGHRLVGTGRARRPLLLRRARDWGPGTGGEVDLARLLEQVEVVLTLDQRADDLVTEARTAAQDAVPALHVAHRALPELARSWADLESVLDGGATRQMTATTLPGRAFPTERVLARLREVREASGRVAAAELAFRLGAVVPDDARHLGESGLAAELAAGVLMCAASDDQVPDDGALADVARAALRGADAAWGRGRGHESVQRFTAACEVIFHRERHAEALSTPLVTRTGEYLSDLRRSTMYQELIVPTERPGPGDPRRGQAGRPRVLVLPGSYGGDFTTPVVRALAEKADVAELDLGGRYRPLAGKMVNADAVRAIAATCGRHPPELQLTEVERAAEHSLDQALAEADIVFADWVDRGTLWASRRARADQPIIARVHSLDALDLWIHLMDWRQVAAVVAVSPPLATLVQRFLDARGARTPVHVIPNLVHRSALDATKTEGARTTLGMVGWGRRVKDALWTLELLRRDPSRRLVLIGRPPVQGLTGRSRRYADELRRALRDPALRARVEVVGQTDDVAGELRKVGFVVSSSRRESWHMGLVEGALSAAVPVVRDWPLLTPLGGPGTIFPADWVVEDLDAADRRIAAVSSDPDLWEDVRRRAQRQAEHLFDPHGVAQRYREVILGVVAS